MQTVYVWISLKIGEVTVFGSQEKFLEYVETRGYELESLNEEKWYALWPYNNAPSERVAIIHACPVLK